jgi:hypothetical protein
MMVVVVIGELKVVEQLEFGDSRGQSSSNRICLLRWKVKDPYMIGEWHVQSKSGYNRRMQTQLGYSARLTILLLKVQL